MNNLSVTIDAGSGFCFGVVFAIEMAEEILAETGHLYCLGDIVHNDMEVKRLEAQGLEIIDHEQLKTLRDAQVLIRAHGEPPETYQLAITNNLELIDASCPVVLKLQNRIRSSYLGQEEILIYGKQDHPEVIALKGQTNGKARVFMDISELDLSRLPQRITLYSQTTKNRKQFREAASRLEAHGFEVKVHDTICRQVSNRDDELRAFAAQHDRIIFVAGRKSSNGKMLFRICQSINEKTHFVADPAELRPAWFRPAESVGICGATSTPQWLMEAVKHRITTMQLTRGSRPLGAAE